MTTLKLASRLEHQQVAVHCITSRRIILHIRLRSQSLKSYNFLNPPKTTTAVAVPSNQLTKARNYTSGCQPIFLRFPPSPKSAKKDDCAERRKPYFLNTFTLRTQKHEEDYKQIQNDLWAGAHENFHIRRNGMVTGAWQITIMTLNCVFMIHRKSEMRYVLMVSPKPA